MLNLLRLHFAKTTKRCLCITTETPKENEVCNLELERYYVSTKYLQPSLPAIGLRDCLTAPQRIWSNSAPKGEMYHLQNLQPWQISICIAIALPFHLKDTSTLAKVVYLHVLFTKLVIDFVTL